MAGSTPNSPQPEDPDGALPPAGGDFSQADIDAALAAAAGEPSMSQAAPQPGVLGAASPSPDHSDAVPLDDAAAKMEEALLAQAEAAEASLPPPPAGSMPLELPDFTTRAGQPAGGIGMLSDVKLNVKIELGRSEMLIDDVLRLGEGSVVELDKLAGDPVDVLVNDRLVARGEVLVLNENFCVRISQILAGAEE